MSDSHRLGWMIVGLVCLATAAFAGVMAVARSRPAPAIAATAQRLPSTWVRTSGVVTATDGAGRPLVSGDTIQVGAIIEPNFTFSTSETIEFDLMVFAQADDRKEGPPALAVLESSAPAVNCIPNDEFGNIGFRVPPGARIRVDRAGIVSVAPMRRGHAPPIDAEALRLVAK